MIIYLKSYLFSGFQMGVGIKPCLQEEIDKIMMNEQRTKVGGDTGDHAREDSVKMSNYSESCTRHSRWGCLIRALDGPSQSYITIS